MIEITITEATNLFDFARCIQIRTRIFVIGQQVPWDREVDCYENECRHYLASCEGIALGTVRWRRYGEETAKIERLAVLEEARGLRVGTRLMEHIVSEISSFTDIQLVKLGSQDHAIPFYAALGFKVDGDGFDDAGIPHHNMIKRLRHPFLPSL
jgi:predicted GNAT family N-acyltransferase